MLEKAVFPISSTWWYPNLNDPVIDLIHAFAVANAYHPKNYGGYSLKRYFLVCLVAMGPSSTLRHIFLGRPWAFVDSISGIPALLLAMAVTLLLNGLPSPIASLVGLLNTMSTVTSVESGVRKLQAHPDVTSQAAFLLGIVNGGGGAVWSILVDGWCRSGRFAWEKLNPQLYRWVFISLFWNIAFWSKCKLTPHHIAVLQFTLYGLLLIDNFVTNLFARSSSPVRVPVSTSTSITSSKSEKTPSSVNTEGIKSRTVEKKQKTE